MTARTAKTSDAVLTQTITREVAKRVVGQEVMVERLLIGLLTGGHILLEGVPGLAKTLAVKTVAECLRISFSRIQFTPDLLPADVIGTMVFDQRSQEFYPKKGPLFANLVLADEINRATPRTQSALLEAMAEAQVTVEGVTHRLEQPFFVIATQNPAEFQGTYPLPESQLDRFLCAIEMGAPTSEEAAEVLARREHGDPIADLRPVLGAGDVLELQASALAVVVAPAIRTYLVGLLEAIRARPEVVLPASMRAGLYLQRAAQAWALFEGRDFVLPDDVKSLALPVLAHRLALRGRVRAEDLVAEVVAATPIPPLRRE